MRSADLRAPRGQIDWATYASTRLATGRALDVPCHFPDLGDDEAVRAAIHWVIRRHRDALLEQRTAGIVVRRLLGMCESLLARLSGIEPRLAEDPKPSRTAPKKPVPPAPAPKKR